MMLKYGADLNAQDNDGYTALMYSVINGITSSVDYLISKGANTSVKNNEGLTAMELAEIKGLKRTKRVVREIRDIVPK